MYGSATIEPAEPVRVAQCYEWTLTYTVGDAGLYRDGGLVLVIPKAGFSSPKLYPPDEPRSLVDTSLTGFVTAEVARPNAAAVLSLERPPHAGNYGLGTPGGEGFIWPGATLYVKVVGDDLREGDVITFVYGDRSSGSAGAVAGTYAHRAEFRIFLDPDGSLSGPCAGYHDIDAEMGIDVLSRRASKLVVVAPSVVQLSDAVEVRVVARDLFGNVGPLFDAAMRLLGPDGKQRPYKSSREKDGIAVFSSVQISQRTGPTYVTAENDRGLSARSNPVIITENPSAPRIFWGDVHVHTALCDGLGTLDQAYQYGRDAAGLDFAAVATHDTLCSDRDWLAMQTAVDYHEQPGRFIPFLAYEYGERKVGGDKTVIYKNNDEEIFRCIDDGSRTPEELWEQLRGDQVITMPHSCGHWSMGTNWQYHNPMLQRLVEIYSEWGNSEYPGNPRPVTWDHQQETRAPREGGTVQEGLLTGARVGFVAASDNHSGQPGYCDLMGSFARRRAYHGGLAAVFANALTRAEIWDGLWSRRCYGTTGARIILYVILNGKPMGSDISMSSLIEDERTLEISVAGTDRIQTIDIVRNNQNIFTHEGQGDVERVEFTDGDPIEPLLLTGIHSPKRFMFYYIRVTQADGEMAWSSPIWISE